MGLGTGGDRRDRGGLRWQERPAPKRQADVERLLTDWFLERPDETGGTPSESHIREHAAKIFKMLQEA